MCRRGELPVEVDGLHTHDVLRITIRIMFSLGGGRGGISCSCGGGGISVPQHDGKEKAHTRCQRDDLTLLEEEVQPPQGDVQQKRILLEARHSPKPTTTGLMHMIRAINNRWHSTKRLRVHNAV